MIHNAYKNGTYVDGKDYSFAWDDQNVIQAVSYTDRNHTPWNKRPGEQRTTLIATVETHKNAKWVSILLEELAETSNKVTRSTAKHITLPEDVGRKIFEQLKKIYGDEDAGS